MFGTWGLVQVLLGLAPKIGLLDRPNERSSHTRVTPRGGGLGFVVLVALMLGAFEVWQSVTSTRIGGVDLRVPLLVYLIAALFVAAVSLRDDFKSLSPGVRFLCQLGAAVAATASIAWFRQVSIPFIGLVDIGWLCFALTVVWIAGLTNVYNFMDGIDGIAGVQGAIAGLAWTVAGVWLETPAVAMLGLMLAGGCAGFLVHNWSPAKIFMGDVGSAFLGFSFAVAPLLALASLPVVRLPEVAGSLPLFGLLALWPFIGDGVYTFLRRLRRGEPVWKPHRSHLYQRLVQSGWSHAQVSSLYAFWCSFSALVGLSFLIRRMDPTLALALSLVSLAGLVLLVRRCEQKAGAKHA
jgi:UDP-N-acetylmuramyl pentapeptide phosphotransferase/UDP-N-acetylglucosamine-1-phosphate transferase